jgi:hypothetical protein
MADNESIPIARIHKNSREDLHVSVAEFRGYRFVDVRTYADSKGDQRVPTPKGIAIRPEAIPALVQALHAAASTLEEKAA